MEICQIQKEKCEYMNLKNEFFQVLSKRVETSFFPKNLNGAHDGAHGVFCKEKRCLRKPVNFVLTSFYESE